MNRLSIVINALAFGMALDAAASIFEEGGMQIVNSARLGCAKTESGISCWRAPEGLDPTSLGETKALATDAYSLCAITVADRVVCARSKWSSSGAVPWELSPNGRETKVLSLVGTTKGYCAIVHGTKPENEPLCWNADGRWTLPFSNPSQLVSNGDQLCALTAQGRPDCDGDLPANPKHEWGSETIQTLTLGKQHACALINGAVRCVGTDKRPFSAPADLSHPRSLVSGDDHSCVITDTGIRCWGWDFANRPYPAPTPTADFVGATKLTAMGEQTCAVTPRGMRCWGFDRVNNWGENQLTLRSPRNLRAAGETVCADTDDGLRCWAAWKATDTFAFSSSHNPVSVAGDGSFICITDQQGQVACQGKNDNHQLDVPPNLTGVRQLASGGRFTCALTDSGVSCWGNPYTSALLSPPNGLAGAEQLAVNSFAACVLKDGRPICWGQENAAKVPENLGTVTKIVAGEPFLCTLDTGKKLTCWNPLSDAPPRLLSQRVDRVEASGGDDVCATLEYGGTRCWNRFFIEVGPDPHRGVWAQDPTDFAVLRYSACAVRGDGVLCEKLEWQQGQRPLMTFSVGYEHPEWSVNPVDVPITAKPAPALRALLPKVYAEKRQFLARVASLVENSSNVVTIESGVPGFAITSLWPFLSNLSAPTVATSVQADFGDAPAFLVTHLGIATLNDWHKSEPHRRFAVQLVQASLSSVRPMLSSGSQRRVETILMVAGEVLSNATVTESDGRLVYEAFADDPQTLLSELKDSPRLAPFGLMVEPLVNWLGTAVSVKR